MKKILLMMLAVTSMAISTASAQSSDQASYIYCELLGTNTNAGKALLGVGIGKNKVTVEIDFGQISSDWTDNRLRGDDGKPVKFNSMVDAMNWMGTKGWEFAQAYVVTEGNQNVYHWLLKLNTSKLSQEDKDALMNSLKTKEDFKEKK